MRYLVFCLSVLIFVSTGVAQENDFVPIMSPYYLLGGSQNGKWLTAETVAPQVKNLIKMRTISLQGVGKNLMSLTNTGEEFGACPENKVFEFTPKVEGQADWSIAVGENAKWDFVPRSLKSISATDKTYQKIAADFLRTKGIARPRVSLSQILQSDLEGDGQNEILIAGNFYQKGMTETQNIGDYSFVLLRKIVGGKAQNILLEGEFFTKKGDYAPPNEREIAAVADLNGDGRMEIILSTAYYEGSWEQVFEISGNKPAMVLEVSCIV